MNDRTPTSVTLPDTAATEALGAALALVLPAGLVLLRGDLGAGKTTLVRGVLRALGHRGAVKSPTYTLVEVYGPGEGAPVHHFDLYRLGAPEELEEMGVRDYLTGDALVFIEWPERAGDLLPAAVLEIEIEHAGDGRRVLLRPGGRGSPRLVADLLAALDAGGPARTGDSADVLG